MEGNKSVAGAKILCNSNAVNDDEKEEMHAWNSLD